MAASGTTAPAGNSGRGLTKSFSETSVSEKYPNSGKDRKGIAMNKVLGLVVLFAFIFSSCATAPVANQSQKLSAQVRVYPFAYFNGGYTNTATLAFKDYSGFRILDAKAAESTEDTKSNTNAEKSSSNNTALFLQIGLALAIGGYLAYDYFTNPDSFLKK